MAGPLQDKSRLGSTPTFYCESGLDLSQDLLAKAEGGATVLQNYEPSQSGGYRRINGFEKRYTDIVPGSGEILHVSTFAGATVAVRQASAGLSNLYTNTGSGWSLRHTLLAFQDNAESFDFDRYNWTGQDRMIMVTGTGAPIRLEDAGVVNTTALATAPIGATTVTAYKNRIFVGNYDTNKGAISYSASNDETNWEGASGAGEIVVGDTIVKIVGFRDKLIILCHNSIHQLTGTSNADFLLSPVTQNIGCVNAKTVQELNGDVLFLAPDGVRTVAATDRIGDFNIASISRPVQTLAVNMATNPFRFTSTTIKSKSQYRIFNTADAETEANAGGIIGGIRLFRSGDEGWEWGTLKGIKPACMDSFYTPAGDVVLHGGFDGYVYSHDVGSAFNGAAVESKFYTPDIDLADAFVRKNIHKVITHYKAEGLLDLDLNIEYDRGQDGVSQPFPYTYTITGSNTLYDVAVYDDATFDAVAAPFQLTPVQGSGFLIKLKYTASDTNAPHSIQGFAFEFIPEGRR